MKSRDNEIIALLLGEAVPPPCTRRWLRTAQGRQELAAYRRTLQALDRLASGAETRGAGAAARKRIPRRDGPVYYAAMRTPIGRILAAATDSGLVRVSFRQDESSFVAELRRRLTADVVRSRAKLAPVVAQLDRYFSGRCLTFRVPVDLRHVTPFQRRVLMAACRVPTGRVVSYGEIARRIGHPRASRAVGQALGRNPVPIVIPCHRVIAGNGGLGGYTGGLRIKKKLLAIEGLKVA
jgi:methylated-DNA-[protein]-cysteine S-methyltransferase